MLAPEPRSHYRARRGFRHGCVCLGVALIWLGSLVPSGASAQLTVTLEPIPGEPHVAGATMHVEVFIRNDGNDSPIAAYQIDLVSALGGGVTGSVDALATPVSIGDTSAAASGSVPWVFAAAPPNEGMNGGLRPVSHPNVRFGGAPSPGEPPYILPGGGARRYMGTVTYLASAAAAGAFYLDYDGALNCPCTVTDPTRVMQDSVSCAVTSWAISCLGVGAWDGRCTPWQAFCGNQWCSKNRYITFSTNYASQLPVAFEITSLSGGWTGYAGPPNSRGISGVYPTKQFRTDWPAVLSVGDCEITPDEYYQVRAIPGPPPGGTPSNAWLFATAPLPAPKFWGDTTGSLVNNTWSCPDRVVNFNDVTMVLQKFLALPTAPHLTMANVQAVSASDPCLNSDANIADVFLVLKAFQGAMYPFIVGTPATCPPNDGGSNCPP